MFSDCCTISGVLSLVLAVEIEFSFVISIGDGIVLSGIVLIDSYVFGFSILFSVRLLILLFIGGVSLCDILLVDCNISLFMF